MVTYGFFNSVYGDRKYDADQMSDFYTGIVTQGVFQHVDNGLEVTAGTGLTVSVNTGRAIIQNKWVKNDTPLVLELAPAQTTYDRFDIVVLKYDSSNRNVQIIVKTGTPVGTPVVPELVREGGIYEMCLAVIDVEAGATSVTVTDTRSDSAVCGWAAVAQATSGEVDTILNDLKTGFDGKVYTTPGAEVRGSDKVLDGKIYGINDALNIFIPVNAINKNTITDNYFVLYNTGNLSYNSGFAATDYIDLNGATKVCVANGIAQTAFYNADKQYISGVAPWVTGVDEISVPSNAKYGRFSIIKPYENQAVYLFDKSQYYEIDRSQPAGMMQDTIKKIKRIVPINAINYGKVTDNCFVIYSNGNLQSNNSYKATDYIDLDGVESFVVSEGISQFAYYNSSKQYVSGVVIDASSPTSMTVPSGAKYARFSIYKGSGNGFVCLMSLKDYYNSIGEKTITVGSGKDYETLKAGIEEAIKYPYSNVYVAAGTYDLIEEFGEDYFDNMTDGAANLGMLLKNGVKVYFDSKAKVVCNYTGENQYVEVRFSPFVYSTMWNTDIPVQGGELHNLNLEFANCRYGVHDECGGMGIPYKHVYKNCIIKSNTDGHQCIGGGLGQNGYIIIDGCVFDMINNTNDVKTAASYHNNSFNGGFAEDKSNIEVTNSIFKGHKNTFGAGYIGAATENTICLLSGNNFGAEPFVYAAASGSSINMEILQGINNIRND